MVERIRVWWQAGQDDWAVAQTLFAAGHWAQVVFHCHECIEKLLKALYVQKKSRPPPTTHNLGNLIQKVGLKPTEAQETAIFRIMPHFSMARYPDAATGAPSESYNKASAEEVLDLTREVIEWLEQHLK